MMHDTSYDACGPLSDIGSVSFSARAANLPGDKHVFEMPMFIVAEEESEVVVEYNGFHLRDFGTWNDYYGFGTSPQTALKEAWKGIEKLDGCNVDITVLTTIKTRPCYISEHQPFYVGSQRVHYIPMSWSCKRPEVKERKEEFAVWQNGFPTGDAGRFYDRIKELVMADAAPSRKGELRSIIKGKVATTRDAFLTSAT